MFTNVVARWPGSAHDSHIFRSSKICSHLERSHHSLDDGVLLGDSGYACRSFVMTPYNHPSNPAQQAYNNAHTKTRVIIEQTFGRWKRRFHVLHSEIRMAPERVCNIIGACAVLPFYRRSQWKMERPVICQKLTPMMVQMKGVQLEITSAIHFLVKNKK